MYTFGDGHEYTEMQNCTIKDDDVNLACMLNHATKLSRAFLPFILHFTEG